MNQEDYIGIYLFWVVLAISFWVVSILLMICLNVVLTEDKLDPKHLQVIYEWSPEESEDSESSSDEESSPNSSFFLEAIEIKCLSNPKNTKINIVKESLGYPVEGDKDWKEIEVGIPQDQEAPKASPECFEDFKL